MRHDAALVQENVHPQTNAPLKYDAYGHGVRAYHHDYPHQTSDGNGEVYAHEPQVGGLDDEHVRERNDLYEQDGPMVWPMKDNERVHWVLALQPAQKVQPVVQQQSDHSDRGALEIQPLHLLYRQRPLWQQQRQQQPFF
jgi:hypothetical protein